MIRKSCVHSSYILICETPKMDFRHFAWRVFFHICRMHVGFYVYTHLHGLQFVFFDIWQSNYCEYTNIGIHIIKTIKYI